jgi:hypothetical protein
MSYRRKKGKRMEGVHGRSFGKMEICQKRGFAARQPTQKWKIQRKKKEIS